MVLLDEPFSNLDVEVRLRLRSELPAVLSRCGASGLIVTHDPEEALAICDRVAVLRNGQLDQCATPRELVSRPATPFVGRFVLQGNLLPALARGDHLTTPLGRLAPAEGELRAAPGEPLEALVSPEAITLEPDSEGEAWVLGREFLGREWLYQVQQPLPDGPIQLRLRLPLQEEHARGQRCRLRLRRGEPALLFPDRRELVAV